MAKLKAPLLSFGASGQIAKTVVYFPWKGLNVARKHVVPANPRSDGQITQRSYVTDAVAKIHEAMIRATHPLGNNDKSAYSLLASTQPTPRTWFNEAIKNWVDTMVSSGIPCIFSGGEATDPLHTHCYCTLYLNEGDTPLAGPGKFYIGTSKTSMLKSAAAFIDSPNETNNGGDPWIDLVAGQTYYWQYRTDVVAPAKDCVSGIYYFKAT